MVQDHAHRAGFRLTFRHLLILSAYFVILLNAIIPVIERTGHTKASSIVLGALVVSPPLLALLVAFIERAGALKNWALSLLIVLFFPALVLHHDCTMVFAYLKSGQRPTLWATLLINGVVLANSLPFVVKMLPRPCPSCRRRTLVPLMRIFMQDRRTANTCWCASCGAKYWKDKEGEWRVERRKTWLDQPKEPLPTDKQASPGGRPEVQGATQRPLGGRAANEIHSS